MAAQNTTIQIRIDGATKKKAIKTFASLGMDMSSGVKMFLTQVIEEQGMPFVSTKRTRAIRAKWDKWAEEAIREGKEYKNAKELFDDLDL